MKRANNRKNFQKTYSQQMASIEADRALQDLMQNLKYTLQNYPEKLAYTREYASAPHVQRLRFALERLHKLQNDPTKKKFGVAVVIFPFLLESSDNRAIYQQIYGIVDHEATRLGFTVIRLDALFRDAGMRQLLIDEEDGIHPNAAGHRLVADFLFRRLFSEL